MENARIFQFYDKKEITWMQILSFANFWVMVVRLKWVVDPKIYEVTVERQLRYTKKSDMSWVCVCRCSDQTLNGVSGWCSGEWVPPRFLLSYTSCTSKAYVRENISPLNSRNKASVPPFWELEILAKWSDPNWFLFFNAKVTSFHINVRSLLKT